MNKAKLIQHKIEELPTGQPFSAASFLDMAERSNIDKTLGRLVKAGIIMRATRGVYVRPKHSRFGVVPPEISKIAVIKAHGEPLALHGAEALRQLGLSTQVPVKPVFYTTARSRTFQSGKTVVRLQQVSPRKMAHAGTNVGTALSALWYLGKGRVNDTVLETIREKLTAEEYSTLKSTVPQMPGWMAQALRHYEMSKSNA